MSEFLETLQELEEYSIRQEMEKAANDGQPISRDEAIRRVNEYHESESSGL